MIKLNSIHLLTTAAKFPDNDIIFSVKPGLIQRAAIVPFMLRLCLIGVGFLSRSEIEG